MPKTTWPTAAGSDAGPVEGGPAGDGAEVGGGEVLERAAEGAEAGAHAGEEDDPGLAWGGHDPGNIRQITVPLMITAFLGMITIPSRM